MNTIVNPTFATRAGRPDGLYAGTAILLAVIAFAGFAQSYWVPLASGELQLHPAMHVHGVLFFLWMLFSIRQAVLIRTGHQAAHRSWGLAGVALAALMVFSGVMVQIVQLKLQLQGPRPDVARNVAAVGFSAMLMFTVFVGVAVANVHRPQIHRRLMMLGSFAILGAAVVRLMRLVPDLSQPQRVLLGGLIVDLVLLAVVLIDRRRTGRVHGAWWLGGGFLLANQVGRALIAQTDPWVHFTTWLAST